MVVQLLYIHLQCVYASAQVAAVTAVEPDGRHSVGRDVPTAGGGEPKRAAGRASAGGRGDAGNGGRRGRGIAESEGGGREAAPGGKPNEGGGGHGGRADPGRFGSVSGPLLNL